MELKENKLLKPKLLTERKYSLKDYIARKNINTVRHPGAKTIPFQAVQGKQKLSKTQRELNIARGMGRKKLRQIPDTARAPQGFGRGLKIVNIAKNSSRGIWKVSKDQAVDIANKYNFYIPDKLHTIKHLGSTGILMWRKGKDHFYLFKPGKQEQRFRKIKKRKEELLKQMRRR